MAEIKKVTPGIPGASADAPAACLPTQIDCSPSLIMECGPDKIGQICGPSFQPLARQVSGTYKSGDPGKTGKIMELRVDVDGRRPQMRLSGDVYSHKHFGSMFEMTYYLESFVVDPVTVTKTTTETIITGSISYYRPKGTLSIIENIEVRIPRSTIFVPPADATVKLSSFGGWVHATYVCAKKSEYFRTAILEIDRYQGETFPPSADTSVDPHPTDLAHEMVDVATLYRRAGVDMTVTQDDVLNDPDGPDADTTWNPAELHDLMEAHFDAFSTVPNWNVWGVVVPELTGGYTGLMFDWGGGQPGDTMFRQGAAVAGKTIRNLTNSLYDSAAENARYFLWAFVHELGHALNLPHTWLRALKPDEASLSFMNYPQYYDDGINQGAYAYWQRFRWEFDDVELAWMRHANRADVIFGGNDWVYNNLSTAGVVNSPMKLEVRTWGMYELGEPLTVELKLRNVSNRMQKVDALLDPEDRLLRLFFAKRGQPLTEYRPPMLRIGIPETVELLPGQSIYGTATLSYGALGMNFTDPGEYEIRACLMMPQAGFFVSEPARVRVMSPARSTEELAHVLFTPEAARLLYFGATARKTAVLSKLKEAAEKYAKSDPAIVRHILAAIGTNAFSAFKHVEVKDGKRVVVQRTPQLALATGYLESALELLPGNERSAFIAPRHVQLATALIAAHKALDHPDQVAKIRERALAYLEKRHAPDSILRQFRIAGAAAR